MTGRPSAAHLAGRVSAVLGGSAPMTGPLGRDTLMEIRDALLGIADPTVSPELRASIREAVSNAFYGARNAGRTMEDAADAATKNIVTLLESGAPK